MAGIRLSRSTLVHKDKCEDFEKLRLELGKGSLWDDVGIVFFGRQGWNQNAKGTRRKPSALTEIQITS